jgi:hypothetical protein
MMPFCLIDSRAHGTSSQKRVSFKSYTVILYLNMHEDKRKQKTSSCDYHNDAMNIAT